ncbi:MAG: DNA-directed RNA polymerase subunit K [Nitrososphaerota archaeon]|nr:DNA-directed RNA polymerase subunit K [Candidatus Calditenuaceae archaeon]MDW8073092.1 DNA-directed RNA polymerase subunit K [Nitrososphaerota archaeon]
MSLQKKLTKYEITKIIGGRALQLSFGAFPLVEPRQDDTAFTIARRELSLGVLPVIVRRHLPDGTVVDIPLKEALREERVAV